MIRVSTHIWFCRESNKGKVVKRETWRLQPPIPGSHPGLVFLLSHSVMSDSLRLMGRSAPGCSPNGIFQAKILEWAATSSSRRSSPPRDWTRMSYVSCTDRRILYHWATYVVPCVSRLTHFKNLRKEADTRLVDTHKTFRVYLKRYYFSLR